MQPVASNNFIVRPLSRIKPPALYLADLLNSYAYLGMPKPFVQPVEVPLGLALDARQVGNQGRFVSEWVPPECCSTTSVLEQVAEKGMVRKETLGFGTFQALRNLNASEEVVLG